MPELSITHEGVGTGLPRLWCEASGAVRWPNQTSIPFRPVQGIMALVLTINFYGEMLTTECWKNFVAKTPALFVDTNKKQKAEILRAGCVNEYPDFCRPRDATRRSLCVRNLTQLPSRGAMCVPDRAA